MEFVHKSLKIVKNTVKTTEVAQPVNKSLS